MNGTSETGKLMLAFGAGILAGKWTGSGAWWLLGGATAIFVMHSVQAQSGIKYAAQKGYSALRS